MWKFMWRFILLAALLLPAQTMAQSRHGIAMHGEPKYGPGFQHFAYVNPAAPKGGTAVFAMQGSFDSLNPLIVKGAAAAGVRDYVFESLMDRSFDEAFSLYGLLAESIESPEDRSFAAFTLRPEAKFSDGSPVTVEDVLFSFEILREHGRPNHRSYYAKVVKTEKIGERTVKFSFTPDGDREMPLIMGLMPVLPRHHFSADTFDQTSFKPPVGSGPYVVERVDPGASITYKRNPGYWGRDLPINRGQYNFDTVRFEYYRDGNVMFEAFKKGLYLVNGEGDPSRWAREYDFPAVADGRVVRESVGIGVPAGMTALVFNTRKPVFADRRVREALNLLFDFEWMNKNLYHGLYKRTQSYFERSELSSHRKPADARERTLLAPFPQAVRPEIMDGSSGQPVSDGIGRNRDNRRLALNLLNEAGYELRGGKLVDKQTGQPFSFEILTATREQERLLLTYGRALEHAGIQISLRQADSAQYQRRKDTFDFDMIQNSWPASLSPGNEQSFRWSSAAAAAEGSFNYPGVQNPAADAMIDALLAAKTREEFVSAVRALDRVLLSGNYVIPLFHLPQQWVAYWAQLRHPASHTLYGYRMDSWWIEDKTGQAASQ